MYYIRKWLNNVINIKDEYFKVKQDILEIFQRYTLQSLEIFK